MQRARYGICYKSWQRWIRNSRTCHYNLHSDNHPDCWQRQQRMHHRYIRDRQRPSKHYHFASSDDHSHHNYICSLGHWNSSHIGQLAPLPDFHYGQIRRLTPEKCSEACFWYSSLAAALGTQCFCDNGVLAGVAALPHPRCFDVYTSAHLCVGNRREKCVSEDGMSIYCLVEDGGECLIEMVELDLSDETCKDVTLQKERPVARKRKRALDASLVLSAIDVAALASGKCYAQKVFVVCGDIVKKPITLLGHAYRYDVNAVQYDNKPIFRGTQGVAAPRRRFLGRAETRIRLDLSSRWSLASINDPYPAHR